MLNLLCLIGENSMRERTCQATLQSFRPLRHSIISNRRSSQTLPTGICSGCRHHYCIILSFIQEVGGKSYGILIASKVASCQDQTQGSSSPSSLQFFTTKPTNAISTSKGCTGAEATSAELARIGTVFRPGYSSPVLFSSFF